MTAEPAGRVLLVDDDPVACDVLARGLRRRGFEMVTTSRPDEAFRLLGTTELDGLVTDLRMRGLDGLALCRRCAEIRPGLPVLVITAFGSLDTAVSAIRAGAFDFITKPFDIEVMAIALGRAIEHGRLRAQVSRLEQALESAQRFEELLGDSPAMRRLFDLLDRLADSDVTVLVCGESGTGKELVASALHRRSRRRQGRLVAVNCAALPEHLLESELFGHARGAFTDARSARPGLLAYANGGTLFLDEVGDMPLGVQAKLLRALQERRVRPLGAESEIDLDIRVIAATNRKLEADVKEGRFREDLYFRLNVMQVDLPPLRARGTDVLLLANHLLERAAKHAQKSVHAISPDAARKLLDYRWPGNVRELANCIERAVALARFDQVTVDDLPDRVREYPSVHILLAADAPSELITLEEVERRYVQHVLDLSGGRRNEAARILGVDRKTLYRKLGRWSERSESGPPDDSSEEPSDE